MMLLKLLGIWLIMAAVGFLNGVARGVLLAPLMPEPLARQVSSVTGSILVFAVAFAFAPAFRGLSPPGLLAVGAIWLGLTVAFEFGLGLGTGKSWGEMLEDYNVLHGRLWALVLVSVLLSPLAAARLRGLV